jgi:hypothetical protein
MGRKSSQDPLDRRIGGAQKRKISAHLGKGIQVNRV